MENKIVKDGIVLKVRSSRHKLWFRMLCAFLAVSFVCQFIPIRSLLAEESGGSGESSESGNEGSGYDPYGEEPNGNNPGGWSNEQMEYGVTDNTGSYSYNGETDYNSNVNVDSGSYSDGFDDVGGYTDVDGSYYDTSSGEYLGNWNDASGDTAALSPLPEVDSSFTLDSKEAIGLMDGAFSSEDASLALESYGPDGMGAVADQDIYANDNAGANLPDYNVDGSVVGADMFASLIVDPTVNLVTSGYNFGKDIINSIDFSSLATEVSPISAGDAKQEYYMNQNSDQAPSVKTFAETAQNIPAATLTMDGRTIDLTPSGPEDYENIGAIEHYAAEAKSAAPGTDLGYSFDYNTEMLSDIVPNWSDSSLYDATVPLLDISGKQIGEVDNKLVPMLQDLKVASPVDAERYAQRMPDTLDAIDARNAAEPSTSAATLTMDGRTIDLTPSGPEDYENIGAIEHYAAEAKSAAPGTDLGYSFDYNTEMLSDIVPNWSDSSLYDATVPLLDISGKQIGEVDNKLVPMLQDLKVASPVDAERYAQRMPDTSDGVDVRDTVEPSTSAATLTMDGRTIDLTPSGPEDYENIGAIEHYAAEAKSAAPGTDPGYSFNYNTEALSDIVPNWSDSNFNTDTAVDVPLLDIADADQGQVYLEELGATPEEIDSFYAHMQSGGESPTIAYQQVSGMVNDRLASEASAAVEPSTSAATLTMDGRTIDLTPSGPEDYENIGAIEHYAAEAKSAAPGTDPGYSFNYNTEALSDIVPNWSDSNFNTDAAVDVPLLDIADADQGQVYLEELGATPEEIDSFYAHMQSGGESPTIAYQQVSGMVNDRLASEAAGPAPMPEAMPPAGTEDSLHGDPSSVDPWGMTPSTSANEQPSAAAEDAEPAPVVAPLPEVDKTLTLDSPEAQKAMDEAFSSKEAGQALDYYGPDGRGAGNWDPYGGDYAKASGEVGEQLGPALPDLTVAKDALTLDSPEAKKIMDEAFASNDKAAYAYDYYGPGGRGAGLRDPYGNDNAGAVEIDSNKAIPSASDNQTPEELNAAMGMEGGTGRTAEQVDLIIGRARDYYAKPENNSQGKNLSGQELDKEIAAQVSAKLDGDIGDKEFRVSPVLNEQDGAGNRPILQGVLDWAKGVETAPAGKETDQLTVSEGPIFPDPFTDENVRQGAASEGPILIDPRTGKDVTQEDASGAKGIGPQAGSSDTEKIDQAEVDKLVRTSIDDLSASYPDWRQVVLENRGKYGPDPDPNRRAASEELVRLAEFYTGTPEVTAPATDTETSGISKDIPAATSTSMATATSIGPTNVSGPAGLPGPTGVEAPKTTAPGPLDSLDDLTSSKNPAAASSAAASPVGQDVQGLPQATTPAAAPVQPAVKPASVNVADDIGGTIVLPQQPAAVSQPAENTPVRPGNVANSNLATPAAAVQPAIARPGVVSSPLGNQPVAGQPYLPPQTGAGQVAGNMGAGMSGMGLPENKADISEARIHYEQANIARHQAFSGYYGRQAGQQQLGGGNNQSNDKSAVKAGVADRAAADDLYRLETRMDGSATYKPTPQDNTQARVEQLANSIPLDVIDPAKRERLIDQTTTDKLNNLRGITDETLRTQAAASLKSRFGLSDEKVKNLMGDVTGGQPSAEFIAEQKNPNSDFYVDPKTNLQGPSYLPNEMKVAANPSLNNPSGPAPLSIAEARSLLQETVFSGQEDRTQKTLNSADRELARRDRVFNTDPSDGIIVRRAQETYGNRWAEGLKKEADSLASTNPEYARRLAMVADVNAAQQWHRPTPDRFAYNPAVARDLYGQGQVPVAGTSVAVPSFNMGNNPAAQPAAASAALRDASSYDVHEANVRLATRKYLDTMASSYTSADQFRQAMDSNLGLNPATTRSRLVDQTSRVMRDEAEKYIPVIVSRDRERPIWAGDRQTPLNQNVLSGREMKAFNELLDTTGTTNPATKFGLPVAADIMEKLPSQQRTDIMSELNRNGRSVDMSIGSEAMGAAQAQRYTNPAVNPAASTSSFNQPSTSDVGRAPGSTVMTPSFSTNPALSSSATAANPYQYSYTTAKGGQGTADLYYFNRMIDTLKTQDPQGYKELQDKYTNPTLSTTLPVSTRMKLGIPVDAPHMSKAEYNSLALDSNVIQDVGKKYHDKVINKDGKYDAPYVW